MRMATFSNKEKIEILQFVENNRLTRVSLNSQEKWEELGKKLNRDWKTIFNAYKDWKIDNEEMLLKSEDDEDPLEASAAEKEADTAENRSMAELPATSNGTQGNDNCSALRPVTSNEDEMEETIQYVTLDGNVVNLDDFDQFILCDTNTLNAINDGVEEVMGGKRKFNLSDFDAALLNSLEQHGRQDLEMQREEHDKKMKILKMQLEHGEEIHNERMKILKAKLQSIQQQVYHIDHVICNRNLKKFKSGPI